MAIRNLIDCELNSLTKRSRKAVAKAQGKTHKTNVILSDGMTTKAVPETTLDAREVVQDAVLLKSDSSTPKKATRKPRKPRKSKK